MSKQQTKFMTETKTSKLFYQFRKFWRHFQQVSTLFAVRAHHLVTYSYQVTSSVY